MARLDDPETKAAYERYRSGTASRDDLFALALAELDDCIHSLPPHTEQPDGMHASACGERARAFLYNLATSKGRREDNRDVMILTLTKERDELRRTVESYKKGAENLGQDIDELTFALKGLLACIREHHDKACPGITPADCLDAIYEAAELARQTIEPADSSRDDTKDSGVCADCGGKPCNCTFP